jgi:hypothetical protein
MTILILCALAQPSDLGLIRPLAESLRDMLRILVLYSLREIIRD